MKLTAVFTRCRREAKTMRKTDAPAARANAPEHSLSRALRRFARHSILLMVLLALSIAGYVILSLLPPLVLGKVVDLLTGGALASSGTYLGLAFAYFGLLLVSGILGALKDSLITILGQKVTHAVRTEMAEKLSFLPASYYVSHTSGEITSLLISDVMTIESLFTSGIVSMVADLCELIGILVVVFRRGAGIGWLLLVSLPLVFYLTRRVQKGTLKAQTDRRAAVARASGFIPETLHNLRTIHVFRAETFLEGRYAKAIDDDFSAMEKSNFYAAFYSPVIMTISAVLTALMMAGAGAAMAGSASPALLRLFAGMSVGAAVADINYIARVFSPLQNIGMEIQNIQSAGAGVRRIKAFLALPEEPNVPADEAPSAEAVDISHLSFGYRKDEPVFQDFSLKVAPGEMVTFTGRTGAGKTTLLNLVMGLYRPQAGTVHVFGRPAAGVLEKERRCLFGYVSQSFYRVPGTVEDQVTMRDPSVTPQQVDQALSLAGLSETVARLPQGKQTPCRSDTFSEGQFQLLNMARAMVKNPKILMLDEVTAKLDAATEDQLMRSIGQAAQGRTVLSVSHRTEAMTLERSPQEGSASKGRIVSLT